MFTGKEIIHLQEVDSTNKYAALLQSGKKLLEGTTIVADFQTGGRGAGTNRWESEKEKNLLLSIIFYPNFLLPRLQFFLNQFVSLAVCDTLKIFLSKDEIKIKWPNDVFAGNKKIAGLLIENSVMGNKIQHSIIGIGLNVNQPKFSTSLPYATSMALEANYEFNKAEILKILLENLEARYLQLKQNKIELLQKDYMKILFRVEEECVYKANGKRFNAKIVGINSEGKLILETGNLHKVFNFKEVEMIF